MEHEQEGISCERSLELEEEDRSYEIEKLLRWRWIGPSGQTQTKKGIFSILWKNYSIDDASWIPEANFDQSCRNFQNDAERQPDRRLSSKEIVSRTKLPPHYEVVLTEFTGVCLFCSLVLWELRM